MDTTAPALNEFTKKHAHAIEAAIFSLIFFAVLAIFGVIFILGPSFHPTEAPAQNFYSGGVITILVGVAFSIGSFFMLVGEDYREFKRDLLALIHKSK
jgi:hypothetical protein